MTLLLLVLALFALRRARASPPPALVRLNDENPDGAGRRGHSNPAVLAAEGGTPPRRVPLHPYGEFIGNGRTFVFDEQSLQRIREWFAERGNLLVLDWHHETVDQEDAASAGRTGGRAPAAAWIGDIEIDDGYVYGIIESWTPAAQQAVLDREYRYISAVFSYDDDGRVMSYHSFGLLNRPGTYRQRPIELLRARDHRTARLGASFEQIQRAIYAALERRFGRDAWPVEVWDDHLIYQRENDLYRIRYRYDSATDDVTFEGDPAEVQRTYAPVQPTQEVAMTPEILQALGLPTTATTDDALRRIAQLSSAQPALTRLAAATGHEDPDEILAAVRGMQQTASQNERLQARVTELEQQLASHEIDDILETATTEGRVTPAHAQEIRTSDDFAHMRERPAVLRAYTRQLPQTVTPGDGDPRPGDPAPVTKLSDSDREVARQLGIDPKLMIPQEA